MAAEGVQATKGTEQAQGGACIYGGYGGGIVRALRPLYQREFNTEDVKIDRIE